MPVDHAANHPAIDRVVEVINPSGAGEFVLVCEHASNFIPTELADLGLSREAIASHIAWDPGALPVARAMAEILDAPLVAQRVSRLVYDCNRPPEAPSAIPERSEIYAVPGNSGLSPSARRARARQYYVPFRDALSACIERRAGSGHQPVIVTVHSFTPVYDGVRREVDIGVLYDVDTRFADAFLRAAEATKPLRIRRNAPYGPQDGVTHTLVEHAIARGLLNVMVEIRNDLISEPGAQRTMAEWLSGRLVAALAALAEPGGDRRAGTGAVKQMVTHRA